MVERIKCILHTTIDHTITITMYDNDGNFKSPAHASVNILIFVYYFTTIKY